MKVKVTPGLVNNYGPVQAIAMLADDMRGTVPVMRRHERTCFDSGDYSASQLWAGHAMATERAIEMLEDFVKAYTDKGSK